MINTNSVFESRVKIQQVVDSQLPEFIKDENPLVVDFLRSYYTSQEYAGGPVDIAENLDKYLKLDKLTPEIIVGMSTVSSAVNSTDTEIFVTNTKGFPEEYGLFRLNDEIITYTGVTTNSFTGCVRGFSGITSYHAPNQPEELVFSTSVAADHSNGTAVQNLSALFLKEFYNKLKGLYTPGLENVAFAPDLSVNNFIKESRSLYQSKGTEESIKILLKVLFGVDSKVIDLEQFLSRPSSAEFIRRKVVVAKLISGNPKLISGATLFQDAQTNIGIGAASGPISEVEIFTRGTTDDIGRQTYYKISLFTGFGDESLVEGTFIIPGSSFTIGTTETTDSVITVDSTIGFPQSGTFQVGMSTVTYTDKTVTQFLGCTGITSAINPRSEIIQDLQVYAYENNDLTKPVIFTLTGVLKGLKTDDNVFSSEENSIISVKNLGEVIDNSDEDISYKKVFFNSWVYNSSSRYFVSSFNGSTFNVQSSIDRSSLKVGDRVDIVRRSSQEIDATNLEVQTINLNTNAITVNGNLTGINTDLKYDIRKRISKATSVGSTLSAGNDALASDILNAYNENNDFGYVASNSLPSYEIRPVTTKVNIATASTTSGAILGYDSNTLNYDTLAFSANVPFVTGDEVFYDPEVTPIIGLHTGSYYVNVDSANPNRVKLALSKSFLDAQSFVRFTPSNNGPHEFILSEQRVDEIQPQKLLKKFPLSQNLMSGNDTTTEPGPTGMLINGVEIVNYKSDDSVYYGPITNVGIFTGGSNYDAANAPSVVVSDPEVSTGTTALVQSVVSGSFVDVEVDPVSFDIEEIVSINITGGNGEGATASATLASEFREVFFNANSLANGGGVSAADNTITFDTVHNFQTGDSIVYNDLGTPALGISTDSANDAIQNLTLQSGEIYFSRFINSRTVQLFNTKAESQSGINTIGITTENNAGLMKFRTTNKKLKLDRINILNPGQSYSNRKLIVKSTGINTANDTIVFNNHNFTDGDFVEYEFFDTGVVGLSTTTRYKVLTVDNKSFRLANAGVGGTNLTDYIRRKHVALDSVGVGSHIFKYPTIEVTINAVTTQQTAGQFTATPVVRGAIVDAYLYEEGSDYGSETLNFEKVPKLTVTSGSGAAVSPIIINGRIENAFVQNGGSGYTSPPELEVTSSPVGIATTGTGARLRALINNVGVVTDVVVLGKGQNYDINTTSIKVNSVGSGAILNGFVRKLQVNKFAKINDNGGEIVNPTPRNGLEYAAIGYGSTFRVEFDDGGSAHSPIIGWSYDGVPIYGSYGYVDPENIQSGIKRVGTGYTSVITNITNRPSTTVFPAGFFVDDFVYDGSGDLDEYNGRFAITNEFPNGVYAYYATIDTIGNPEFPFFVGPHYRCAPIAENLDPAVKITQSFDFNNSDLVRNTFPQKIGDSAASYDFVIEPYKVFVQDAIVESISRGSFDSVSVAATGNGKYGVGDVVNFIEFQPGEGTGLAAEVSSIVGKSVVSIASTDEIYENVVVKWKNSKEVELVSDVNFDLIDQDVVQITGLSTFVKDLTGSQVANTINPISNLVVGFGTTGVSGMVTDISVANIPVSIGNSIKVSTETLGVLNVFDADGIIRVKRYPSETANGGVAHTATESVSYLPQAFTVNVETPYFESKDQDVIYFNPFESIGIGITAGFTTARSYQFNGVTTTRTIQTQNIFLPNHPFVTNQHLAYVGSGTSTIGISTSPTGNRFDMPADVFAIKTSKDTIGIATVLNGDKVYFRDVTNTDFYDYVLQSQYQQITADVKKVTATVTTGEDHNLENADVIKLDLKSNLTRGVGAGSSIVLKIAKDNLLVNPVAISSAGVNTSTNVITLTDHEYSTGDKVFYESTEVIGGLTTGTFYIYTIDKDNFSLGETERDIQVFPPNIVSLTSVGGTSQSIARINPPLSVYKNDDVVFNLEDTSLTGFELKIYYDQDFFNSTVSTGQTDSFLINSSGTIGSAGAALTVSYSTNFPEILYYNVERSGFISTADKTVTGYNEIQYNNSVFSGEYAISGVTSTTYGINLTHVPERVSYASTECDLLKYTTKSTSANGSIDKVDLIFPGLDYKKFPSISSITSGLGTDTVLRLNSSTVGKLDTVRLLTPGFSYPSDKTLSPEASIPNELNVRDYQTLFSVSILSGGRNFQTPPNVILYNPSTNEVVPDFQGSTELAGNSVSPTVNGVPGVRIDKNPVGLEDDVVYEAYTVNNDNGVSIVSVASTQNNNVTLQIATPVLGFTTAPFQVGDSIFVEGIGMGGTTGEGHNSADYGYQKFTVASYDSTSNPNLLTYNLNSFVSAGASVGIAQTTPSLFAQVILAEDLPVLRVTKQNARFEPGELLYVNSDFSNGSTDLTVISFNDLTGKLNISGSTRIESGDTLTGGTSGSKCTIDNVVSYVGSFEIDAFSDVTRGWKDDIGKLSEDYSVMGDNDYYQRMSYSIQSEKTFDDVISYVNENVHPSGFKNFKDMQLTPSASLLNGQNVGASLTTAQEEPFLVLDVIADEGALRVDTINDFDFARDVDATTTTSKSIDLENIRITDYILNKTNRVIPIDDISGQFLGGPQDEFLSYADVFQFASGRRTNKFLVQTRNITENDELNVREVILVANSNNTYTLEKAGAGDSIGEYDGSYDGVQYALRFSPNDPDDVDYEIKALQTIFTNNTGFGSQAIGFVDLYSQQVTIGAANTSTILGFTTAITDTIYGSFEIYDSTDDRTDYVEVVLTHNDDDTHLTEVAAFNTNVGLNGLSGPFIGTFGSDLTSGVMNLVYHNDGANEVTIKSQIIGIGTTATGIGTYRFAPQGTPAGSERTGRFESNFALVTGGTKTKIAGISSTIDGSAKALVRVSIGETQAIHQVYVTNDSTSQVETDVASFAYASVNDVNGIGTFSAEYSNDGVDIMFHPDYTGDIEAQSFSEIIYTELDQNSNDDGVGGTTYGGITQQALHSVYFGLNQRDKTAFEAKHNGSPIYAKTLDPSNTGILSTTTGTFTMDNFFYSGEELQYRAESNLAGVAGTGIVYQSGAGTTARLPETVYAIRLNQGRFRVAISTANALAGTAATFTAVGSGNQHIFSMVKRASKTLLTIDNIAQGPISRTPFEEQTMHAVGAGTSIIQLSGIASARANDILRINDEYMRITTVGLGSTNASGITGLSTLPLAEVTRGYVGSSAVAHGQFDTVTLYRGAFNIIDSTIHFTEPPRGPGITRLNDRNLPLPRSSFQGRVYLRKDYDTNAVFDDIADEFDGTKSNFILTSDKQNITGIGTTGGNGIVFINGIFQSPSSPNNPDNNFGITESSGISSITFTGVRSDTGQIIDPSDINKNQLPRGGVPITFGSTTGLGFAPLVPAEVIPTVTLGQLTAVSGVSTTSPNVSITNVNYDNVTGVMTVTAANHELTVGDKIRLRNIQFTCPANGPFTNNFTYPSDKGVSFDISSFVYDNLTGLSTVGLTSAHNFRVGRMVHLEGIEFSCAAPHTGVTTTIFPDGSSGRKAVDINKYPIIGIAGTNSFLVNVGVCTIPHNYVGNGTAFEVKPTGPYYATKILSDSQFETQVGIVTFAHTYNTGGTVAKWNNATFGSGYSTVTAPAIAVTEAGHTGAEALVSATVGAGGTLIFTINQAGSGYVDPTINIAPPSYDNLTIEGVSRLSVGATTEVGLGMSITVGVLGINTHYNNIPIVDFDYTDTIGIATVSAVGHGFTSGDLVRLKNLQFSPAAPVGSGGTIFPYSDISVDYTVLQYVDENRFTVNIGIAETQGVGYAYSAGTGGVAISGVGATMFEVKQFDIPKRGYGFLKGDVFRITGITTDPTAGDNYQDFTLSIVDAFQDNFASWQFGELDYIDSVKAFQDGINARFPLAYNDQLISFETDPTDPDSVLIDIKYLLLVFVNGILQVPGESYEFFGGTSILFSEAPAPEDNVDIFFYRGTGGDDSFLKDVYETLKPGDEVRLKRTPLIEKNDAAYIFSNFSQEYKRTIVGIKSSSEIETTLYRGEGVNTVEPKPLSWTKQKVDKFLGGTWIPKARDSIEAQVYPTAKIIGNVVSTGTTQIFVDNNELFLGATGNTNELGAIMISGFSTAGIGSTTTVPTEVITGILPGGVRGYQGIVTGIQTSFARLEEFTGFDVSKTVYRKQLGLTDGTNNDPQGLFIRPDGEKLYVLDGNSLRVTAWNLSTAFELDTATIDNTNHIGIGTQLQSVFDLDFSTDGTRMYVIGQGAAAPFVFQVNQFNLTTPWELTSVLPAGVSTNTTISNQGQLHRSLQVVNSGQQMITLSPSQACFRNYDFGTNFDITTISFGSSTAVTDDAAPSDFNFSTNGEKMLVIGADTQRFLEYNLTSGWDISTLGIGSTSSYVLGAGVSHSSTIKPDGERVFLVSNAGVGSQFHFSVPPAGLGLIFQLDLTDVPGGLAERQELVRGYRMLVYDTAVGTGVTTIVGSAISTGIGTDNVIGISSNNLDNIYEVYYSQFDGTNGIATCFVDPATNIVGIATTGDYHNPAGKMTWGRITGYDRGTPAVNILPDGNHFDVGMSTYPTFQRRNSGLRDTGALKKSL